MFWLRSRSRGDLKAPRWVGERIDSLRRSVNSSWSALRAHDSALKELENRIGTLERRDRAEAQRDRRASQGAASQSAPPAIPPLNLGGNTDHGYTPEQMATIKGGI